MNNEEFLARKVKHYEAVIEAMQGHTFYCEDGDGMLRRWHPPGVRKASDFVAADKIKAVTNKETAR